MKLLLSTRRENQAPARTSPQVPSGSPKRAGLRPGCEAPCGSGGVSDSSTAWGHHPQGHQQWGKGGWGGFWFRDKDGRAGSCPIRK